MWENQHNRHYQTLTATTMNCSCTTPIALLPFTSWTNVTWQRLNGGGTMYSGLRVSSPSVTFGTSVELDGALAYDASHVLPAIRMADTTIGYSLEGSVQLNRSSLWQAFGCEILVLISFAGAVLMVIEIFPFVSVFIGTLTQSVRSGRRSTLRR
jgi:hypothetical protein